MKIKIEKNRSVYFTNNNKFKFTVETESRAYLLTRINTSSIHLSIKNS